MYFSRTSLFFILALIIRAFFSTFSCAGQPPAADKDYFSAPLEIPLFLSGNFAELRRNHFHSGIDIKTAGVEGQKVLAAAPGFISRIRVSPYGYGKALYIDHPNGFTTVYAHLRSFVPEIEEMLLREQRKNESYETDMYLDPGAIEVLRGQQIAWSGNTGGSGGPHLHFEIRETQSEQALNPLLFNFDIRDDIPPTLRGLRVYPANDSSIVEGRNEDRSFVLSGGHGNYLLKHQHTVNAYGEIYFGLHTFDLLNGYSNKCGIYSISLFHNEKLIFRSKLDKLNFETFRQINTYKDFRLFHEKSWHYHRSFKSPFNELEIYEKAVNNGIVSILPGSIHQFKYVVTDTYGNSSSLEFKVSGVTPPARITSTLEAQSSMIFKYNADNHFEDEDIDLFMPANRLYNDIEFRYGKSDTLWACLAPLHHIHDPMTPVDNWFNIRLKAGDVADSLAEKVLITKVNQGKYHRAIGGRYKDGWVSAKVREFGDFTIRIDTTPPAVKPLNVYSGKLIKGQSSIDFNINDNLSGIKHYEARVNGEWLPMEYEPKNSRLTLYTKKLQYSGPATFELKVTDERNNTTVFSTELIF